MKLLKSACIGVLVSMTASTVVASEVDHIVRINNVDTGGITTPRLVVKTNFSQLNAMNVPGDVGSISYFITEVDTGTVIYSNDVTIGQSIYSEGNANTGKTTVEYDPVTDIATTRFVIKVTPATTYDVGMRASFTSDSLITTVWTGNAQIESNLGLQ